MKNNTGRIVTTAGFTLVEVTVVLVVIGLITGALLAGKALSRESKVNSIMADAQQFITATKTFKDQYAALPGDIANATSIWGTEVSCPPSAATTGILTCNGNGDGQIGPQFVYSSGATTSAELLLYWQHLANAQLIAGNYSTYGNSDGASVNIGIINSPAGKISGSLYGIQYFGTKLSSNTDGLWGGDYGHALVFGKYSSGGLPLGSILTVAEMESFDNKFDDGIPGTGKVQVPSKVLNASTACATVSTAYNITASSNDDNSGPQCSMLIITGF